MVNPILNSKKNHINIKYLSLNAVGPIVHQRCADKLNTTRYVIFLKAVSFLVFLHI